MPDLAKELNYPISRGATSKSLVEVGVGFHATGHIRALEEEHGLKSWEI